MKLDFKKFEIPKIETEQLVMSPIELKDYIDFEVKRVYFITEPKSDAGGHCHKEELELFVMQKGSCTAVIDKGNGKEEIEMKAPRDAIYVGKYVWHYFKNFSKGAVLLALSSTNYDPERLDYIEDYEEYKNFLEEIEYTND